MCYKISYKIERICKSLGIPYHSKYLEKTNFHADAIRLNELYYQMKQTVAEMVEIADKHDADELSKLLWNDIRIIENVDHHIMRIAKKLGEGGYNV